MNYFSVVKEIAAGLKSGARYATLENHSLIEKGVQPKLTRIGSEYFGR